MAFDIESWKFSIKERLHNWKPEVELAGVNTLYGFLASMALAPVVQAAVAGDPINATLAMVGVAGAVGGNLLAEQVQRWQDQTNRGETAPDDSQWLYERAAADQDVRDALDTLLGKLDVLEGAQSAWPEEAWGQVLERLGKEMERLGNARRFEAVLIGDGVIAQESTVAQAKEVAIAVGGTVEGGIHIDRSQHFGSIGSLTIKHAVFQAPADPAQVDPRALLLTYLNRVVTDTATLDLSGIDRQVISDREEARLELTAVYTALDTVRAPSRLAEGGKEHDRMDRIVMERGEARQSALAFINETKYAALLGDPGSGKTTFANFLALCLAGELLGLEHANLKRLGEDWSLPALMPLRVVLRDFAAQLPFDGENPIWAYLTGRMGASLAGFAPLLNRYLLEEGGLLVLDGLDEVPESRHRREAVKKAVQDFRRIYPNVRILLTSRTYAYQRQQWRVPGFTETVLAPFNPEQIDAFVDRWYAHMAQVRPNLNSETAQGRATLLKHAIERTPHLNDLAPRPLLLTLMASLHAWRGGSLPEQREELYDESVNLLLDFWERPKIVQDKAGRPVVQSESAAEWFKTSRQRIQQELEQLTFDAHKAQPVLQGTADIQQGDLVAAMLRASEDPDLKPARVVEYICDRAGLLTNKGEGVFSFPHRTFQEYLAARYLTRTRFPNLLVSLIREDVERWREVALLAGAKAARGAPHSAWSLTDRLCRHDCTEATAQTAGNVDWWMAMLAGRVLTETGIYLAEELDEVEQETLLHVRRWLAALLQGGHLPSVDRAAAGVVLAKLGDPREGVGVSDGLPDILWSQVIPAVPFPMGNDKPAARYSDEQPRFQCTLIRQPYRISRYPVTVAQYQAFVKARGYEQRRFWTEAGWAWKEKGKISGPQTYRDPFQTPNHPQVGVSWYEAHAFCQWLADVTGLPIRLPSEAEWERAARHTDARLYPWGQDAPKLRCNMRDTGIGSTCAVGLFPDGDAVCGAADMSGNMWEWCRTKWLDTYERYEQQADDDPAGSERRVVRGGSWVDLVVYGVRCAVRGRLDPFNRNYHSGFRVVCSPCESGARA